MCNYDMIVVHRGWELPLCYSCILALLILLFIGDFDFTLFYLYFMRNLYVVLDGKCVELYFFSLHVYQRLDLLLIFLREQLNYWKFYPKFCTQLTIWKRQVLLSARKINWGTMSHAQHIVLILEQSQAVLRVRNAVNLYIL